MYKVSIYNSEDRLLEVLEFAYISEADATAEAFENLTDYNVVRDWEE